MRSSAFFHPRYRDGYRSDGCEDNSKHTRHNKRTGAVSEDKTDGEYDNKNASKCATL